MTQHIVTKPMYFPISFQRGKWVGCPRSGNGRHGYATESAAIKCASGNFIYGEEQVGKAVLFDPSSHDMMTELDAAIYVANAANA